MSMLKKPSEVRVPKPPATMEVESTRVQTLPDGKKMIDVTMRRTSAVDTSEKLVLPQFDDDDSSSSSSDDDDNAPPRQYDSPTRFGRGLSTTVYDPVNSGDDNNSSEVAGDSRQFQGDFQWSGVQDIQHLTHANAALHELVNDLKAQVKSLQIQLEAMAPVPGLNVEAVQDILLDKAGADHDIRDAKIVHQAKTLRHLKRAMQRDKQIAVDAAKKCKSLEAIHAQLQQENETLKLKLARFQARATANSMPEDATVTATTGSESSALTAKDKDSVSVWKKKFEDMRIKHDKVVADLKKTQRALVREVGEDVNLDELVEANPATSESAAKRGRAQQIVVLKAKIKKLEQGLQSAKGSTGESTTSSPPAMDVDTRAQHEIAAQQAPRQRLLDKLTGERDELQEKLHQQTKRYDALKSRTQTLEKEKQDHKAKLQALVDKSRNDDALVDALQKQLEMWKGKLEETKRARTAESVTLPKDERMEIDRLRALVNEYKRQAPQNANNSPMMPATSEAAQYRIIAAEKERLSELVKTLQSQVDEKDRQIRTMTQNSTDSSAAGGSRIPRLASGVKAIPPLPATQHYPTPPSTDPASIDALRKTMRDAIAAKDHEIEALKAQVQQLVQQPNRGDDAQQEIQDLQEENDYLRQEFDRLKTRYEAVLKSNRKNSQ